MMKRLAYWILMFSLILAASGCGREQRQVKAQLLQQSREAVKKLDTSEALSLQERIDSLAEAATVTDTLVGDVCAEVAKQLRQGRRYKELWAYTNDANSLLEKIVVHDYPMRERIMNLNLEMAESYFDLNMLDRFMQMLIKLDPMAKRYGLINQQVTILINKATIYNEKGQEDKALQYLHQVIQMKDKLTDKTLLVFAYNDMAWAWRGKGNFDKAVEYAMLALHHVPEGYDDLEMRTRSNLGTYYNRMHEYSLAQKQLEIAVDYYNENEVKSELCVLLPKLAQSLWKQGRLSDAEATFERAMSIRYIGTVAAKTAILRNYAQFCDSIGDQIKQVDLLQQLCSVNDSIILGNNNEMLTQLYSDELATSDKNLRDYRRSRVELWVSVAVLLAVLAGALWWMERRYRRLGRQRDEIAAVSDERHEHLMVAAVDEMKFTAFTQKLATELQDLQKTVANEPSRVAVQELRKVTSQVMRMESERNNELTTLANAEFFKRLLERYPDLTNNDLRICALLRRGMTSKEIADIMCRESQTIDITRTRIRRKCGLQPDEDLNTFMMKI